MIVGALLVLLQGSRHRPVLPVTDLEHAVPPPTNTGSGRTTATMRAELPLGSNWPNQASGSDGALSRSELARSALAALNDEDIVLYGRVIDQFGAPVSGASVSGLIGVNNGVRVGADRVSVVTDASGLFTISGCKGKDMGVNVKKPGYVLATATPYFVYSRLWPDAQLHVPDPNTPVTLKMWKLQGAEPLSDISRKYNLAFSGDPILLDLLGGQVVANGGDLQIVIKRSSGSLSKRAPADWSVELLPIDGGILESDHHAARVTFEAPLTGYKSGCLVRMDHGDRAWFDSFTKTFFLKSRGGQVYSRFDLDFGINLEPNDKIWVQVKGVANTNGSRNWEATAPIVH
jgi:hypothetical protein